MMKEFSFEKASKFRKKDRYFNINYLWAPGFPWVVKKLYYTPIRPEIIVLSSLLLGLLSATLYAQGNDQLSIVAALLIFMKNFLDTVDGHLARAKGVASRIGRFLDSLSDAAVYLFLFTGIAYNLSGEEIKIEFLALSYLAMVAAFLQCSVYNYYVVTYKTMLYGVGVNKTEEAFNEEERVGNRQGLILCTFQWLYLIVYGWQDKLVTSVDKMAFRRFFGKNIHLNPKEAEIHWYRNKTFLSLYAPLSFGTQIFALALFTLWDKTIFFLYALILSGTAYTLLIFLLKIHFLSQPPPNKGS